MIDGAPTKIIISAFVALLSAAIIGLVGATLAHMQLLSEVTTTLDSLETRLAAHERQTRREYDDTNDRLRFLERMERERPPP